MSLTGIFGWMAWGIVALAAIVGLGIFVWQLVAKIRTPVYWWNEIIAGWALRLLLGLQVALLGTIAILFLVKEWAKLHLLWVTPLGCFPVLLMWVVCNWFRRSLENEQRFVEDLLRPPDTKEFPGASQRGLSGDRKMSRSEWKREWRKRRIEKGELQSSASDDQWKN